MPIPLLPVAGIAMSTGAVAFAGYKAFRHVSIGRRDQRAEDALDDLAEGATLRRDNGQANGTLRWQRVVRIGERGPAFSVDASIFARLKIKRVE